MPRLPEKYTDSGTTIFTIMSALAQEHGAINLSQGFPDFAVDDTLGQFLLEAAQNEIHQYAPMSGLLSLRQEIAVSIRKRLQVAIDSETEITITPGATYAIYTAFAATIQPGDEVIVFEPAYDSYVPAIELNGAKAIRIQLIAPSFSIDWNKVKDAITLRTKAIILTTPHNPTGTTLQTKDWNILADIIRDTEIVILSDEVYDQLVYDGKQHNSVLQHTELRQRSFAMYSFGKSFHITGWKVGYCIAPPAFTRAFRKIHQYLCFSVNTPAQYALTRYMQQPSMQPVHEMMQYKRDYFLSLLSNTPFTIYQPSAGSYFQLAGYQNVSDLPDHEFAVWLTKSYGVATIPVSAFYRNRTDDKLVRFCFAKKKETLQKAAERLSSLPLKTGNS